MRKRQKTDWSGYLLEQSTNVALKRLFGVILKCIVGSDKKKVYTSEVLNIGKSYPNLDIIMKLYEEISLGNSQATSVLQYNIVLSLVRQTRNSWQFSKTLKIVLQGKIGPTATPARASPPVPEDQNAADGRVVWPRAGLNHRALNMWLFMIEKGADNLSSLTSSNYAHLVNYLLIQSRILVR